MSSDKYDVLIRFNGKNYSAWAFHFKIFVKGKDLWGHIDAPDKDKDEHSKWEVKDAQIMTWILGSVESNIILNLRPFKTAAEMWNYLKKLYSQHNTARRFQLEHELASLQQGSLSISDFILVSRIFGLNILILSMLPYLPKVLLLFNLYMKLLRGINLL